MIKSYAKLMRLDKPIGIYLLLWPTLWALVLAGQGSPNPRILCVFVLGVIVMRSAGCIANDLTDRRFDAHVERTMQRPLVIGTVSVLQAITLLFVLLLAAFSLVLFCNQLTIKLAFIGAALTMIYPWLKRVTHFPQVGIGVAFSWGVPMAFAAQLNTVPLTGWYVFAASMLWPVIYDTFYALADKRDDINIGVKSTAIFLGDRAAFCMAILQMIFISLLIGMGILFQLAYIYYAAVFIAGLMFIYQQWLIKDNDPAACIKAFKHNNWVGMVIFFGIYLSYWV